MACVLVSVAGAAVTAIAAKALKSREAQHETVILSGVQHETAEKVPFSRKLKWLSNMLWGGSALLMFEHVWHGEIVPWFPFLTAAETPVGALEMLREMATTGVAMTALVTAVWLGIVAVTSAIEKKALCVLAAEH